MLVGNTDFFVVIGRLNERSIETRFKVFRLLAELKPSLTSSSSAAAAAITTTTKTVSKTVS